jgi:sRNA-binding regulator protein Hfq
MVKAQPSNLHKKFQIKSNAVEAKAAAPVEQKKVLKPAKKEKSVKAAAAGSNTNQADSVTEDTDKKPVVSQALGNTPRKIKGYDREYAAVMDKDVIVHLNTDEQIAGHFVRTFQYVLWVKREERMVIINKVAILYVQPADPTQDN